MSLSMTFRQKLIRVGCSAAICGLSFSFIIGEAVDREAKMLRSWESDPALIPNSYLPMRPLARALEEMDSSGWKESLVALNSLPVQVIASPRAEKIADAKSLTPAPLAQLVSAERPARKAKRYQAKSAIDTQAADAEQVKSVSAAHSAALPKEVELKHSEVEVILASIHGATSRLSLQGLPVAPTENSPSVSKSQAPKETPAGKGDKEIPAAVVAAVHRGRAAPKAEIGIIAAPWVLNGRILATTAHDPEPGHYEVGLFSKIDPDGHPVGFPLPQQILPAGQTSFRLEIPSNIEKGYLFAEFIAAKTGKRTLIMPPVNPWTSEMRQVAELYFRAEDKVTSVVAGIAKEAVRETTRVKGRVLTMFSGDRKIPQGDVVVKLRGRKESTRSDSKGEFSLELPKLKGSIFLEVLKPGYHPTIVSVEADEVEPLTIEIASRHAIEQVSQRLGSNQGSAKGIFIGRATSQDGSGLRGMTAQLSLKADGPFYFDDEGVASRDLRQTSSSGRFMFLNVEAGNGYLEAAQNGDPLTPLQVSTVEGGEMIQKDLTPISGTIRGRVFNPVTPNGKLSQIGGARVRIDGTSDWVTSDSFGAFSIGPLKWFKGEKITLELTAEKFNNHRYQIQPKAFAAGLNLFAFPANYVSRLARSMDLDLDPYAGVVIGKVSGAPVRVDALADHSTVNSARDFYFDSRGRLRGSHEMTDPRYGTFMIFNVPKGRTLIHGNDSSGKLRYSDGIVSNAASINVLMD